MRRLFQLTYTSLFLLTGMLASAQIGVNTNEPTANLDVNGTLRVRSLEKTPEGFTVNGTVLYIMGVDQQGNVIPIEIGENIVLENNTLQVKLPEPDPAPIELPNSPELNELYESSESPVINNLDLGIVILPGDRRGSWPVYRLENGERTDEVEITGIKAAENGAMAYLYPTSGSIMLRKSSELSESQNQIVSTSNVLVSQNEMVLLMYDAVIQKWVVVSK